MKSNFYLFDIETKPLRNNSEAASWGAYELSGDRHLSTPNEANGMVINYYLRKEQTEVEIEIINKSGDVLSTLEGKGAKGTNQVIWRDENQKPGVYNVTLKVDNKLITKSGVLMPPIPYSVVNYKGKK